MAAYNDMMDTSLEELQVVRAQLVLEISKREESERRLTSIRQYWGSLHSQLCDIQQDFDLSIVSNAKQQDVETLARPSTPPSTPPLTPTPLGKISNVDTTNGVNGDADEFAHVELLRRNLLLEGQIVVIKAKLHEQYLKTLQARRRNHKLKKVCQTTKAALTAATTREADQKIVLESLKRVLAEATKREQFMNSSTASSIASSTVARCAQLENEVHSLTQDVVHKSLEVQTIKGELQLANDALNHSAACVDRLKILVAKQNATFHNMRMANTLLVSKNEIGDTSHRKL
eukprot:m.37154 g.37154  ORF g.37154 m.37154 type:complete len:288 (-) comp17591_c0_seq1:95-958(-)